MGKIYKTRKSGNTKVIAMPKDSADAYIRKTSPDGTITFLPVRIRIKMPKPEPGQEHGQAPEPMVLGSEQRAERDGGKQEARR